MQENALIPTCFQIRTLYETMDMHQEKKWYYFYPNIRKGIIINILNLSGLQYWFSLWVEIIPLILKLFGSIRVCSSCFSNKWFQNFSKVHSACPLKTTQSPLNKLPTTLVYCSLWRNAFSRTKNSWTHKGEQPLVKNLQTQKEPILNQRIPAEP